MSSIAVVLAMQSERDMLERVLLRSGFVHIGQGVYRTRGVQVAVILCGVCAKKIRLLGKRRDILAKCDIIFVTGLAGGINPVYKVGDCIVPDRITLFGSSEEVIKLDTPLLGYVQKTEDIPFKSCAVLATVRHIIHSAEKKTLMRIDAVDMESYQCMKWMKANDLSAVCIRFIGDSRSDYIPPQDEIVQWLHWTVFWMLKRLIHKPFQTVRGILFLWRTKRALKACAGYMVRIILSV